MGKSRIMAVPSEEATAAGAPRDMAKQEFARRLQRALLERRPEPWSQADLARAAGLGRDAISTYVRGRSFPEPASLAKIARALHMKAEDLVPDMTGLEAASEIPALEVRQLAGHPEKVWLRINQAVTLEQVGKIIAVLNDPALKT